MSKAKPLTRIHKRAELIDSCTPRLSKTGKRYIRENSPRVIHGEAGMKTDNVRGRFSIPYGLEEMEGFRREQAARSEGRKKKRRA